MIGVIIILINTINSKKSILQYNFENVLDFLIKLNKYFITIMKTRDCAAQFKFQPRGHIFGRAVEYRFLCQRLKTRGSA